MELVAPAGGPEQLRTAVHFGADVIYLAGKRWGMRSRAENFSDEELAQAVAHAHAHGVAVNVALNIVLTDADVDDMPPYLRFIDEIGVDGAIVGDLGTLTLLREHAPHVEPHLSTQSSVMSARTADAWAALGVRRVVLAREMTLAQIAELRRRCTSELSLEAFVHGSMCMAVSGRCLLSADLMGRERSASNGACTQPCRWDWSLAEARSGAQLDVETDSRGSYLLSSDDLCMIEHLDELREAGVDALKVEGRAKGSYYVACVTNAYRHVLDGAPMAPWRAELDAVSHRPYSTGFYYGSPQRASMCEGYVRERLMVGMVSACGETDAGWLVELLCRNRCPVDATVEVLSPGHEVRSLQLADLEGWNETAAAWAPSEGLARSMDRYRFRAPFVLEEGDVLCVRA